MGWKSGKDKNLKQGRFTQKLYRYVGVLEFAKRGWRAEAALACTVASESKRATSPFVVS